MKESEKILEQARSEENDFKALNLHTKALREARLERFEDYIPALLENGCIIIPFNGQKVVIDTQIESIGILDYFPKANKVCKRQGNEWIKPGLKYIVETLLK